MGNTLSLPAHLAGRSALRPRDLADSFGLSRSKVRALIVAGKLDAWQLDGVCLVSRESVEAWLATATPPCPPRERPPRRKRGRSA